MNPAPNADLYSTIHAAIADPAMARALMSGRKTQMRVTRASALATCVVGDNILVREACIAGRIDAGRRYTTSLKKAEFVIFPDGWRRYRNGSGHQGKRLADHDYSWTSAKRMPRWASRMTLVVEWIRTERLQQITPQDIRAEGAIGVFGGLYWRWPKPNPGRYLTAHRAFARHWNIIHAEQGERWEDNPQVAVLEFRVVRV